MSTDMGARRRAGALGHVPAQLATLAQAVADLTGVRRLALALFAGALSALALAPFYGVPFLFVTMPILVWLIDGAGAGRRGLWRAACAGWAFGFAFFLVGLHWIGNAFLVDADTFGWMIPFVAVLLPGGLALFPALACTLARAVWLPGAARLPLFAVIWVASEWLRGHVLTGFPWNLLGHTWGSTLVMEQTVAYVGVYGLSLITTLCAVSPAALAAREGTRQSVWFMPAALAALALLAALGALRLTLVPVSFVDGIKLRLVHASLDQQVLSDRAQAAPVFSQYLTLSAAPGLSSITHIIWPEAAAPIVLTREPVALQAIADLLAPGQTLMTGSARVERSEHAPVKVYNSMHVVDDEGQIIATYDKSHLVPFGEFLPAEGLLERLGLMKLTGGLGSFARGSGPRTLSVPETPLFGPLICYEIIFPAAVRDPAIRPEWFVNMTDDSWFGAGVGPRQHFDSARLRAIEEGIPVARAANRGTTAIIDSLGRIVAAAGPRDVGALDGPLPRARPATLYGEIGDLALLLAMMSALGLAALFARRSSDS